MRLGNISKSSEGEICVSLVHGTWAPNAKWTREGSRLRVLLKEHLASRGAQVSFEPFTWSGRNSHHARDFASQELRIWLWQRVNDRPAASHYVVAHSHGASVALHALLRDPLLRQKIAGVIAIATPFLRFERRPLQLVLFNEALSINRHLPGVKAFNPKAITVGFVGLPLWLVVGGFMLKLGSHMVSITGGACRGLFGGRLCSAIGVVVIVLVPAILGALQVDDSLRKSMRHLLRKRSAELLEERSLSLQRFGYFQPAAELRGLRVFVQSSIVDEALGGLTMLRWLERGSQALVFSICAIGGIALISAMFGLTSYFAMSLFSPDAGWRDALRRMALGGLVVVGWYLVHYCVGVLVAAAERVASRLAPLTGTPCIGRYRMWYVRASRTPGLEHEFRHRRYSLREILCASELGWFHSMLYSNKAAIRDIGDFMTQSVD